MVMQRSGGRTQALSRTRSAWTLGVGRSRPLFSAVCAAAVAKGTTSLSNSALLLQLPRFPWLRVLLLMGFGAELPPSSNPGRSIVCCPNNYAGSMTFDLHRGMRLDGLERMEPAAIGTIEQNVTSFFFSSLPPRGSNRMFSSLWLCLSFPCLSLRLSVLVLLIAQGTMVDNVNLQFCT